VTPRPLSQQDFLNQPGTESTVKIDAVTLYHMRIPMSRPFRISVGEITNKEFVVVELMSDGVSGWGEAAVDAIPFYTYETVDTALAIGRSILAPLIRSRRWDTPGAFAQEAARFRGHSFTKAAFENALWDLSGRKTGTSVAQMLCGGPPARDWVETGPSLGIEDEPARLVDAVGAELARGFRRIKLKVCPGHDADYLEAVRNTHPDAVLMVDANAGYRPEDIEAVCGWDRFDLMMIEQPLAADDLYFHAQLARPLRTPLCLDESIENEHLATCAMHMKACDIVNIKVGRVGGLSATRRVHDICLAHAIPVWIGSRISSSIANAARVAAASLPNATYPTDAAFSSRYLTDDLVETPLCVREARFIQVPTEPGLGVTIDRDKLDAYSIARETL
jgi:O-succinylbenzoate synthase